jgi:hypothetical protein
MYCFIIIIIQKKKKKKKNWIVCFLKKGWNLKLLRKCKYLHMQKKKNVF